MEVIDYTIISGVIFIVISVFTWLNRDYYEKDNEINNLRNAQDRYFNLWKEENNPKLKQYYEIKMNNLQLQITELERENNT